MKISGWIRLWIVAGALGLSGCGQPTPGEAMTMANSAVAQSQALQQDLRTALNRIEELERKVEALETARAASAGLITPPQVALPAFGFDTAPASKKSSPAQP